MPAEEPTNAQPNDDTAAGVDEAGEPASVFGNLPRSRPGARSPRRDEQAAPRARSTKAKTAEESKSPPRTAPEPPRDPEPVAPAGDRSGGGVEDVAWAGVAAAAEAATIGVRLATRALEAMRDAVDRR